MTTETEKTRRLITLDDLYQMRFVEDVRLNSEGTWAAYVRVDLDKPGNTYKRNIWLSSLSSGANSLQLTRGNKDSQPRWSPDGQTLAFLSGRGDKPQVYLLPLTAPGGEARQFTSHPNGVSGFNWSPDGTQIAFLAAVNAEDIDREDNPETAPADKLEGKHRTERRDDTEQKKLDPRINNRVPYRQGTVYLSDRFAQIYVIGLEEGAKSRRLTSLDTSFQEPQWSPDGNYIYTGRAVDPQADEPYRQSRLYRIRVDDGTSETLQHGDQTDVLPVSSPDGQWVAYIRFPEDKASMRLNRLAVIPTSDGEPRDLTLDADLAPVVFRWSGDHLLFSAESRGSVYIHQIMPTGDDLQSLISGEQRIESFDVNTDGTIVYIASTPDHGQEVFALRDGETTRLTSFNQPFRDEIQPQIQQHLTFKAPDGFELEGWYLLPPGYETGKQYPLLLYIHGGPHIMWGPSNPAEWYEWQNMAARGYVVFYCNPRGSGGYGEAFQMAVHGGGWGDLAYNDIMAGVDTLIHQGLVDPEKLFVTGGSYGGYMTTWMVSHTDRFKAAVAQRGVYNLLSFFGTTDIPTFVQNEFGVFPMEDAMFLWSQSPLAHAHKIKTPLLILHAENDYRVPISEAEQMFGYVRRTGTPTELVRFPRDGHELTRAGEPEHRIEHLKRILDWFERFANI
ncbi:MAG: S9 family peptidase [Anaerolineae bacterium]|nr:S9 family peptidase [Anaerolineae bacterium]